MSRSGRDDFVWMKAVGVSMESRFEAGIGDGDIMAVELTGFAQPGDVVVAEINGEYTVKRLKHHAHGLYLVPANDAYPIRKVQRSDTFRVVGRVRFSIHDFRKAA